MKYKTITHYAQALGKLGGKVKREAKAAAARKNDTGCITVELR